MPGQGGPANFVSYSMKAVRVDACKQATFVVH